MTVNSPDMPLVGQIAGFANYGSSYLATLDPTGTHLVLSTCFGGSGQLYASGIALGPDAFITKITLASASRSHRTHLPLVQTMR